VFESSDTWFVFLSIEEPLPNPLLEGEGIILINGEGGQEEPLPNPLLPHRNALSYEEREIVSLAGLLISREGKGVPSGTIY